MQLGIELLTRDYSEVQKGKDFCDRICGMAKARMRSWVATGNDLLNAIGIKEGMKYAGGIKNSKVAVTEIIPDTGIHSLGKKNFAFCHRVFQVIRTKQMCQMFPYFAQFAKGQTIRTYSRHQVSVLDFRFPTSSSILKQTCELLALSEIRYITKNQVQYRNSKRS